MNLERLSIAAAAETRRQPPSSRRALMERVPAPVESAVHDRQTDHDEEQEQGIAKAVTMRRVPRQARGERRIAGILQAAAQVFYEIGLDAATTGRIAQRAQTAIG